MKRFVLLAGLVAACLVFSGCGNKNDKENDQNTDQTVEISEGPDENDSNLVSMEKDENTIDKSKISKYLGTKATNSGEVVITNETGREISEFYMRPTPSSDENTDEDYEGESWGSDLIQGDFTLKDNEWLCCITIRITRTHPVTRSRIMICRLLLKVWMLRKTVISVIWI